MKLDMSSMLLTNMLVVNAPKVTVKAVVPVSMATAKTARKASQAASWIQMISVCVVTQRSIWDGAISHTWNSN